MKKDKDKKLSLDDIKGFVPDNFDYSSEMPYVKVEVTYESETACFRGEDPISVDSIEFVNPKGVMQNKSLRPAIETIYPKTSEETNELLMDALKLQVIVSKGKFMDMPHIPMGAYYKTTAEHPDGIVASLKDMKTPSISDE